MSEQTLFKQTPPTSVEKTYVLCDNDSLFISFDTAQQAFDWIAANTPGAVTHVVIGDPTLTEGEDVSHQLLQPLQKP